MNIKKRLLCFAPLLITTAISSPTYATAFLPQEARSMAMGGAGVAVGNSRQAHYYNPSLLVNAPEKEDFSFEIDTAIRISDSDKLLQSIQDLSKNKPFENLDAVSNAYSAAPNDNNARALNDAITLALDGIESISNKSLTLDLNVGFFASVPNKSISWAVFFNTWTNFGWQGNLTDNDKTVFNDIKRIADAQLGGNPLNPQDALFQANELTSSISMQGVVVQEIGVALAKHQTVQGYDFDIGITPKIQTVSTFGQELKVFQTESEEQSLFSDENTQTSTTINFDVGISKTLDDNWKAGFVIKNLIPKTYEFSAASKVTRKAKISPSARIGLAYTSERLNAGIDLDLTKNDDAASYTQTRFLGMGVEFDVWLVQLRGGYRHNFAGSGGNSLSAGLGLYLFGVNIDAAVASNKINPSETTDVDNINGSLQIGFNW